MFLFLIYMKQLTS